MKRFKKLVAAVATAAMVISSMLVSAFATQDTTALADGTAYLSINKGDWSEFEATYVNAEITGDGTYTVSMTATEELGELAAFQALQVVNGEAKLGTGAVLTITKVVIDGAEVELTGDSYTCSADAKGIDTRVNIYNEYNSPNTDANDLDVQDCRCAAGTDAASLEATTAKIIEKPATLTSIEVTFDVTGYGSAMAAGEGDGEGEGEGSAEDGFDPSSKDYFAQLYLQFGGSWSFRNPYSDTTYGGSVGYADCDALIAWVDTDGDGEKEAVPHEGAKFEDVKLLGNGTYSVKFTTDSLPDGCTEFNLIGVSTNIPGSAIDTVKFTDVKIIVNNMMGTAFTYPEGSVDEDTVDYLNVLGVNIWNNEVCTDANGVFGGAENWPGTVTSVEVQFTVSGFDYDKVEEPATEAPNNDATQAPAAEGEDGGNGFPLWAKIAIPVAVVVVVVIVVVASSKKKKTE